MYSVTLIRDSISAENSTLGFEMKLNENRIYRRGPVWQVTGFAVIAFLWQEAGQVGITETLRRKFSLRIGWISLILLGIMEIHFDICSTAGSCLPLICPWSELASGSVDEKSDSPPSSALSDELGIIGELNEMILEVVGWVLGGNVNKTLANYHCCSIIIL